MLAERHVGGPQTGALPRLPHASILVALERWTAPSLEGGTITGYIYKGLFSFNKGTHTRVVASICGQLGGPAAVRFCGLGYLALRT